MTNLEKLRETFPKTIFIFRKNGNDETAAIMVSDEWLQGDYEQMYKDAEPCEDAVNVYDVVEKVWEKISDGEVARTFTSLDVAEWFSDLPRIKFAEDVIKENDERGVLSVPENCITGEKYEEWLYEKEPCEDAIDRQALRARFNHLDEVYEGMSEEEKHEAYIYGQIIRAIDDAPTVIPTTEEKSCATCGQPRNDAGDCILFMERKCVARYEKWISATKEGDGE